MRAACCRGLRKVWSVELAKMRGLAGKELRLRGRCLGAGRAGRARRRAARLGAAACGHGAGLGWRRLGSRAAGIRGVHKLPWYACTVGVDR